VTGAFGGGRWRDLLEDRFGPYQTAKRRNYRWIKQGVFDRILEAISDDHDMEWNGSPSTRASSAPKPKPPEHGKKRGTESLCEKIKAQAEPSSSPRADTASYDATTTIASPTKPLGNRGILCQTQPMARDRNTLQETCRQLPRPRQARQHHAVARVIKMPLHSLDLMRRHSV
jgi:transposase